jgi:phage/plasmid primase-like uncharacterized protein
MTRFDTKTGKLGSQYAGYVSLFADMEGAVFGDWVTGFESVWQARDKRKMSESELIDFQVMVKTSQQKAIAEKAESQKITADFCSDKYKKATIASGFESKYLLRKRLDESDYRVKLDENQTLILPVRDLVKGDIWQSQKGLRLVQRYVMPLIVLSWSRLVLATCQMSLL